jgi:hypothetical protein
MAKGTCAKCRELLDDYHRAVDLLLSIEDKDEKQDARGLVMQARDAFRQHLYVCRRVQAFAAFSAFADTPIFDRGHPPKLSTVS